MMRSSSVPPHASKYSWMNDAMSAADASAVEAAMIPPFARGDVDPRGDHVATVDRDDLATQVGLFYPHAGAPRRGQAAKCVQCCDGVSHHKERPCRVESRDEGGASWHG